MKLKHRTFAWIVVLCLVGPTVGAADVTVGSFIERIALAKQITPLSAASAADELRAQGVSLPADLALTAPLTEGHVARISRALGLDVSTNRPQEPFTAEQVDRFFSAYRVEQALRGEAQQAVAPTAGGPRFDPLLRGKGARKGKKKGHGFAPSEPE